MSNCLDLLHPHKKLLEIPLKLIGLIVKSRYLKCWRDGAFESAVHLIPTQPQGRPLILLFLLFRQPVASILIYTTWQSVCMDK